MIRQIQKGPPRSNSTPLFLFHDASGTISSYYQLDSIGRDVYAIADPRHDDETPESLQQMCRRYTAAIKKVVPEGRILLGGWSLGGMIALQVAWNLARDPTVKVDGVIMVDSPYPAYEGLTQTNMDVTAVEKEQYIPKNKLEKSILLTVNLLHRWRAPVWRRGRQPHTVMLCANDRVKCDEQPALSFVDQFRESHTLGWNDRAGNIVHQSYTIEGHHFSLFEPQNAMSTTETIAAVAIDMERMTDPNDSD